MKITSVFHERWTILLVASVGLAANLLCCESPARASVVFNDIYPLGNAGFDTIYPNRAVTGGRVIGTGYTHASFTPLLWTPESPSGVNLHPGGYTFAGLTATDGLQMVGEVSVYPQVRALLWTALSSNPVVELHPTDFVRSSAIGVAAGRQVGYGIGPSTFYNSHALLWSGSAESMVSLHPPSYHRSEARATNGTEHVGWAGGTDFNAGNAFLWPSSSNSGIDLHPGGFYSSVASALGGGQQVGSGRINSNAEARAIVWSGTAASAVDLHPLGYRSSEATGTNGTFQIGFGKDATGRVRPWLWNGTRESGVDLADSMPSWFGGSSMAQYIDGDVIYGIAYHAGESRWHAVSWTVPEPAITAGCFGVLLSVSRRPWGLRRTVRDNPRSCHLH